MSNGAKPFYGVLSPPQPETQAQYPFYPEPPQPPDQGPIIQGEPICEQCKEPVKQDDVAVEILLGFLRRGKKSGRWLVEQFNDEATPVIVHDYCCTMYCMEQITGEDLDAYNFDPYSHEKYCSGCSVKLDG
jgi:hypothetical protein